MDATPSLPRNHILETQPFTTTALERLFDRTDELRLGKARNDSLAGRIMLSLFYEPSSRTRLSFESAMARFGGRIIGTENAAEFSSAAKGESLEDTIRVMGNYADLIVLRHTEDDAALRAAKVSSIPIINAGCGKGQHPTQALLDVYTIRRRLGRVENIRLALMGDLKHGRTVRSLAYLAGKFPGVELHFVSPEELGIRRDMRMHFAEHGVKFVEHDKIDDIISAIDVLYVTRLQAERMSKEDSGRLNGSYKLTHALARRMKHDAVIMHPLPRVDEIEPAVDALPQAAYLTEQVENGLYIRMALLEHLLAH